MRESTVHLLSVAFDFELGWAVRARHERQKERLSRLIRAGIPHDARRCKGNIWFVANDYSGELREILEDVLGGDRLHYCERCERSEPCPDVWSTRTLEREGFVFGEERHGETVFADLNELLDWYEQNRPTPFANPSANGMSLQEAATLLDLTLPTTPEKVEAAFKRAAFQHHPDRGGSTETMQKIIQARVVLRGT
jgi:hypothetical protein